MDIPWVYLIVSLMLFVFGLDVLIRKRGGLHFWKPPFRCSVMYYRGKAAIIVGTIALTLGLIFTVDAISSVIRGYTGQIFPCLLCSAWIILLVVINLKVRKYATVEADEKGSD
jgi:hypothetical protein